VVEDIAPAVKTVSPRFWMSLVMNLTNQTVSSFSNPYLVHSFVSDTYDTYDINHQSFQSHSSSISEDIDYPPPPSYSPFITALSRHNGSFKNIETVFIDCCCSSSSSFRGTPPLKPILALENGEEFDEYEDCFDGDILPFQQSHSGGVVVVIASIRAQWEVLWIFLIFQSFRKGYFNVYGALLNLLLGFCKWCGNKTIKFVAFG
jgi:hypothetical protein